MSAPLKGTCLCGSVKIETTPKEEQVSACHCNMCRKWTAGPFIALGAGDNVTVEGEGLATYPSSEWGERVFCSICGTSIAWKLRNGGDYHLNANLFEETESFPMEMQVFIDEKPENYAFVKETKTLTGPEIFAMFASEEQSN